MQSLTYQIQVRGRIPDAWMDAFFDLNVSLETQPGGLITRLSGKFADPAALQGVLNNLYMLGLQLISVECLDQPTQDSR